MNWCPGKCIRQNANTNSFKSYVIINGMSFLHPLLPPLLAHAFGVRYELPLPLWLFVAGGAGVVFLSFLLIKPAPVKKPAQQPDVVTTRPPKTWPAFVSTVLFVALVLCGLAGSQEVSENILPTLFWLVFWIAVPLSCGILGNWTGRLNLFAIVSQLSDRPNLRKAILGSRPAMRWPSRLGWWPAAVLYFVLACGELIFNQTATLPHIIASGLLGYLVLSAGMGLVYGPTWLERGEVFSVLYDTWGRLGYWRFGSPGKPGFGGGNGDQFNPSPSRLVFVLLLLASVAFDGFLSTPTWNAFDVNISSAGLSNFLLHGVFVLAFLLVIGIFWLIFGSFSWLVGRLAGFSRGPAQTLSTLLPSLLPISFGYLLAHNIQYIAINSQLLFPLLGNPVGSDNWPIHLPFPFNDSFEPNIHIFSAAAYWYTVLVIIVAHIVAIVIANRRIDTTGENRQQTRQAEYSWLAAMVLYTALSLWLLAQPLVKEKSDQSGFAPSTAAQSHLQENL
jgi:hypothetical protein